MSPSRTVADLLQSFAGFERRALDLYRHFARLFAERPDVATIWRTMSDAEAGHSAILLLAEDRLPPHHSSPEAGVIVDERHLAEWTSRLEELDDMGRRTGLSLQEAAEVTLTWEVEELPRLLALLSALPEPARRITAAGFIEGVEEHLQCLRNLLSAVGHHALLPEVSRMEPSVERLRYLAAG